MLRSSEAPPVTIPTASAQFLHAVLMELMARLSQELENILRNLRLDVVLGGSMNSVHHAARVLLDLYRSKVLVDCTGPLVSLSETLQRLVFWFRDLLDSVAHHLGSQASTDLRIIAFALIDVHLVTVLLNNTLIAYPDTDPETLRAAYLAAHTSNATHAPAAATRLGDTMDHAFDNATANNLVTRASSYITSYTLV
ncbi:hypothetical protein DFP72DRAFT_1075572 [Ephemerocybe angulata]|uniref:Uncharacterized protein n=1 Tax=Ephemerocybe angulata TaxID=980116 RepID=A0A8H6HJ30_9AGAR|nr:hypothetical protein DFP72DRAFT_1075572 [Tulosesus angulatus]